MMKKLIWVVCSALILMVGISAIGFAQDVELPMKWTGDGSAKYLSRNGIKALSFQTTIKIDSQGEVSGSFSNSEGSMPLVKLYYGEEMDGARHIVMVLLNKESDNPFLYLLSARVLKGELVYGEVFVKSYESNGSIESGLNLDDHYAQEIYEDYMPSGLKNALKECKPVGCFLIQGQMN